MVLGFNFLLWGHWDTKLLEKMLDSYSLKENIVLMYPKTYVTLSRGVCKMSKSFCREHCRTDHLIVKIKNEKIKCAGIGVQNMIPAYTLIVFIKHHTQIKTVSLFTFIIDD